MRNRASNPLIPRSNALPLSHKDSTVEAAHYEVHITHVLHTARISNVDSVMFVDGIREMVSFELGKEVKKDVYRLVTSMGQIKDLFVLINTKLHSKSCHYLWINNRQLNSHN